METGKGWIALLCFGALGSVAGCSGRSDEAAGTQRVLVFAVHDGDSVKVQAAGGELLDVRLDGIDAPELDQAFGEAARDELSALVLNKSIVLQAKGQDRFGRTLGVLLVDGEVSVNKELVLRGFAWHFKKHSKDAELAALEIAAREGARGLWAVEGPVPPWDHRAQQRRQRAGPQAAVSVTDGPVRGNVRSRRYHLPGCKGYDQVLPKNRVGFESEEEAVAAGYQKAGNCR